jgi:hypothetical protein
MIVCATGAWAGLEEMIPAAKEVEMLGQTVPLGGGVILLLDESPQAKIAAAEINSRIEELGGEPLLVEYVPRDTLMNIIVPCCIVLGNASDDLRRVQMQNWAGGEVNLTEEDPGPQGYVIRSVLGEDRVPTFVLGGSDAQGMLHAAVTFRHMLEATDEGVVVNAANVRDWPDFKQRNLGRPFEETLRHPWAPMHSAAQKGDMARAEELAPEHLAKMRAYLDWLLRHKINVMGAHGSWSGGTWSITDWEKGIIRQMNEYAKARGITAVFGANISIGRYPGDKDNPDFADIVMHSSHKRYFCWSRLSYHEERAARIAQYMADCGYGALYLHDVDGGSWSNPALWNDRCELCRETYGDDHARADRVVFGIYYDAMRELIPDAQFFAVIYPYNPNSIDPAAIANDLRGQMGDAPGIEEIARRAADKNRKMLERLEELAPDDWAICIRENTRDRIDLIRDAWGKHPFYLYYEYMHWKKFNSWFSTSPRMTGTFFYEGYDDIMYGAISGQGFLNPLRLYAAECAWNSRGPDYETFDYKVRDDRHEVQAPPELAARRALQISADLYGADAAPYCVPLFTTMLDTRFIFKPEEIASRAGIDDIAPVMAEQYEAAQACTESMDQLFDRILAGEITPKPLWAGELTNYYLFSVGAEALAGYKLAKLQLEDAIIGGDLDAQERIIADLEQSIEEWDADIARVKERTRDLPIMSRTTRLTVAKGYLMALTGEVLREDLQGLLDRRAELAAAYSLPQWFRDSVGEREFTATRAETPPTIDGALHESVWANAEPIEHFVVYNDLRLAARETVGRIAWDDENLYVAFECFDPDASALDIPPRQRDRHESVDSVDVLVDSGRDRESFVHYILDAGGNIFDARRSEQQDGTLKHDRHWDGNLRQAVSLLDDRWIAEVAIPVADLGTPPARGQTWGIHIARNIVQGLPAQEATAPAWLGGDNFHTVEKYAPLSFAGPESRVAEPKVKLAISDKSLTPRVHTEGAATDVKFDLRLDTVRSLHNVRAVARLTDPDGQQVLEQTVLEEPLVELMWRSRRPVTLTVKRSYEGLLLDLEVTADEGAWSLRDKLGEYRGAAPGPEEVFAPGRDGQALAATMFAPSFDYRGEDQRFFAPSAEGTFECWLCPTEDVVSHKDADRYMRAILDIGPVRYDHPHLTNYRTIAAYISKHGWLIFTVTSHRWENRSTQTRVTDWKAGQWHHIACQWKLDDGGKCRMAIYLDGKLAGERVTGAREGDPDSAMERNDEVLPIQIGAMNTGFGPAHMLIDELRFSLVPRYEADFEPPTRLTADEQTSLLFHFDDGLSAESGLAGVKVTGEAGTVG